MTSTTPTTPSKRQYATPAFQTTRLTFTPLAQTDATALHELRSAPECMKWSRQGRPDASVAETQKWLDGFLAEVTAEAEADTTRSESVDSKLDPRKDVVFAVREVSHVESGAAEDRIVAQAGFRKAKSEVTGVERFEIGYMFVPGVWGKGYASEAVKGMVRWWFDLYSGGEELEGVYSIVAKTNPASLRVMEKCGFRFVAEGVDDHGEEVVEFCINNE
ncbi:GNAT domain-containing protein [Aspergillus pseudodeflectus]|uniref:GNAT domain-containing protein n=1 Tax=Aspergillus pseudodeflectus TaxID=176178 RepID=A0ABR4JGG5_9EURO